MIALQQDRAQVAAAEKARIAGAADAGRRAEEISARIFDELSSCTSFARLDHGAKYGAARTGEPGGSVVNFNQAMGRTLEVQNIQVSDVGKPSKAPLIPGTPISGTPGNK